MPIYEFECPKCKSLIEIIRSVIDSSCNPGCFSEGCDGVEMRKLISKTSFVLAGSGWSKDGYRSSR